MGYQTIAVRPLSPALGAEIDGIDIAAGVSDAQFAELRHDIIANFWWTKIYVGFTFWFKESVSDVFYESEKGFALKIDMYQQHVLFLTNLKPSKLTNSNHP